MIESIKKVFNKSRNNRTLILLSMLFTILNLIAFPQFFILYYIIYILFLAGLTIFIHNWMCSSEFYKDNAWIVTILGAVYILYFGVNYLLAHI